MADSKISALPASTTPLAGTEVLPIVQSSTTRQVSVANLTAGRAISATQLTLTTGNVIVASGQGIDFSATAGTGTSELLADYEEGTWTPIDSSGAGLVLTGVSGYYTKVGRLVTVSAQWTVPVNADSSNLSIGGLPFTTGFNSVGSQLSAYVSAGEMSLLVGSSTQIFFYGTPNATRRTNANYSGIAFYFAALYMV